MRQQEQNLLSDLYEHYYETHSRHATISFDGLNYQERANLQESLEFLEEDGYLHLNKAIGLWSIELTKRGIEFAENGYHEPQHPTTVSGNNNIVISGSENTVSNNYNRISTDISNADIPQDVKELIQDFLYDMQNPHASPEKKAILIRKFLQDIASGTLSKAAASGLLALFQSLFDAAH